MHAVEPVEEWGTLYGIGAAATVAVLALVPLQVIVFIAQPPPRTVVEWFALFDESRLIALVDMDVLLIVDNVLIGVMMLAIYIALRGARPSLMLVAGAFELVAIPTYCASNPAFEMLSLSARYAGAASDADRLTLLGAGDDMIASWEGSAFNVSYVLGALAFLITSAVMLQSRIFCRATAYVGLLFGTLSLVPASAGKLGFVLSLASLVPMWIWLALIARTLFRLRAAPTEAR